MIKSFYNKYLAWHYRGTINKSGYFIFGLTASFFSSGVKSLSQDYLLISIFLFIFIAYIYGGLVVRRIRDIGWPTYLSIFAIIGLLFPYISGIIAILLVVLPGKKIEKK